MDEKKFQNFIFLAQASQQGCKSVRISSNQIHDMEDFYFSKDFHHPICCWTSKVKKGILTSSARVLISLCTSQIGRLLLSYLGLIHIQAYSQPYLESRSKISFQRGDCHYWCFNHQQVLLLLFWMFDNAANVEIKETEVFFSLRGNLRQRGESTTGLWVQMENVTNVFEHLVKKYLLTFKNDIKGSQATKFGCKVRLRSLTENTTVVNILNIRIIGRTSYCQKRANFF